MIPLVRMHWRREALCVGLAAMESCWLYPWLRFFLGNGGPVRLPVASLLGTILVALYVTRFLDGKATSLLAQRAVTVALAVLSVLFLLRVYVYGSYPATSLSWLGQFGWELGNVLQRIPQSLVVVIIGLYLWWRGISLAQMDLDVASVGLSFRVGIIAFFWLFVARLFGTHVEALGAAFAYFAMALVVVGLARIQEVTQSHVGIRTPFDASWMAILTAAAFGVVALGVLSARILSLRTIAGLADWLHPLFDLLGKAAAPLLGVLAWLLEWFLNLLIRTFRNLFGTSDAESTVLSRLAQRLQEIQPVQTPPGSPSPFLRLLNWGFLILVICIGLAALVISIGRRQQARQRGRTVEHGSANEDERAGQGVRDLLGSQWQRLWEELESRLAGLRGQEYGLASIRAIYASLVKLGTTAGFPRNAATTPYEYALLLHTAFPENADDVSFITEAYVRAHYGERHFPPDYVQRVRTAWLAIRARQEQSGVRQ